MSDTNRVALRYAREASYNVSVPPITAPNVLGTTNLWNLRFTKDALDAGKDTVTSDEIRPDRLLSSIVQVGQNASGGFSAELVMQDYDDFISAVMQADLGTNLTVSAEISQTPVQALADISFAANPSNGNTFSVTPAGGGVTKVYTFKTAVSVEGDILIGGSSTASQTNFAHALLHTGTPGTDYIVAVADPNFSSANLIGGVSVILGAAQTGSIGNSITIAVTGGVLGTTGFSGGADGNSIEAASGLLIFKGQKFITIAGALTAGNNGVKPVVSVTDTEIILGNGCLAGNDASTSVTLSCNAVIAKDAVTATITQSGANTVYTATSGTFSAATKGARYVKFAGATNANNNGVRKVVSATNTVLTVVTTAAGFTGETGSAITSYCNYVRTGVTYQTYLFQKEFLDIPTYLIFTGCGIDTMTMTLDSKKICTLDFTVMGYKGQPRTAKVNTAAAVAASTNFPVNSASNVGTLQLSGSTSVNPVKTISLKVDNNLRERPVIGDLGSLQHGVGESSVSGQVDVYFSDPAMLNAYLNHQQFALEYEVVDATGHVLNVYLPAVQATKGAPMAGEKNQDVMQSLPFTAFADPTVGYQLQIDHL